METALPVTVSSGVIYNLATFPEINPVPVTEIVLPEANKASLYSVKEGVLLEE